MRRGGSVDTDSPSSAGAAEGASRRGSPLASRRVPSFFAVTGFRRWLGTTARSSAEVGGGRPGGGVDFGAVGEPVAERVLFGAVVGGVVANDGGHVEAALLPFEAASDGPGEDRGLHGGVGAQRELDALVAFGFGDHVDERELQDASPDRGVVGVDAGPVVRGEPELEDGLELERLAVEEPGGDGVASGEELEEPFRERLAVVDLDAITKRAPARRATSLRIPASPWRLRNVSKSAVAA